jgi:hypothetical protein
MSVVLLSAFKEHIMIGHIISRLASIFGAERARGVEGLSKWRQAAARNA